MEILLLATVTLNHRLEREKETRTERERERRRYPSQLVIGLVTRSLFLREILQQPVKIKNTEKNGPWIKLGRTDI